MENLLFVMWFSNSLLTAERIAIYQLMLHKRQSRVKFVAIASLMISEVQRTGIWASVPVRCTFE
jgi:hypothetical protein